MQKIIRGEVGSIDLLKEIAVLVIDCVGSGSFPDQEVIVNKILEANITTEVFARLVDFKNQLIEWEGNNNTDWYLETFIREFEWRGQFTNNRFIKVWRCFGGIFCDISTGDMRDPKDSKLLGRIVTHKDFI